MIKLKYIIILFFLINVGLCFSQSILIEQNYVEYGKLKKGENGIRKIKIQNDGDKPLIISNVKTSCGCTIPSWPKKPIMPGKIDYITIKYDTKQIGIINKIIEIFSNDPKAGRKLIKLKGEILK